MIKKDPLIGVELFRIFAAFAIVCIHAPPFTNTLALPHDRLLFYGFIGLCRFAVPYFFLIGGYFYGKKIAHGMDNRDLLAKRLKHLSYLFVIWSSIYLFLPATDGVKEIFRSGATPRNISDAFPITERILTKFQEMPLNFLFEGNTGHLWFFIALMSAYCVLFAFCSRNATRPLLWTAATLYLFGLLNSHYRETPLGIHLPFTFDFKNGPFFSTLFVALGFTISKLTELPSLRAGLTLATAGFLIQSAEAYALDRFWDTAPQFNYLAGTIPLATGLFIASLNVRTLPAPGLILKISHLTLGIYVFHLIAEKTIRAFIAPPRSIFGEVLLPVGIFILSAISAWILKNSVITRPLVS